MQHLKNILQAREEYRLEKQKKQREWAARVIQRRYIQWKVKITLFRFSNEFFKLGFFF